MGVRLAAFVPESALVPFIETVVALFNQWGPRPQRHRARLKWLVAEEGEEGFRQMVQASYEAASHPPVDWLRGTLSTVPPRPFPPGAQPPWAEGFGGDPVWAQRRLWPEQAGLWAVALAWPGGSLTPPQARLAAEWANLYGNGLLSTTTTQQLVIHGVSAVHGPELIGSLQTAAPRQFQTTTVVSCPGAPYCNLAITRSGSLARMVGDTLADEATRSGAIRLTPSTIRICGCPHSCTHVRFADVGLMGGAARLGRIMIPVYRLWLGGSEDQETPHTGVPTVRIPARRVPEAVRRLCRAYADEAQQGESFGGWARRQFLPAPDEGGNDA